MRLRRSSTAACGARSRSVHKATRKNRKKNKKTKTTHQCFFQHWFQSSAPDAGTKHIQCWRTKRGAGGPRLMAASESGSNLPDPSPLTFCRARWRCDRRRRFLRLSVHSRRKKKKGPFCGFLIHFVKNRLWCFDSFDPCSLILQLLTGNGVKTHQLLRKVKKK